MCARICRCGDRRREAQLQCEPTKREGYGSCACGAIVRRVATKAESDLFERQAIIYTYWQRGSTRLHVNSTTRLSPRVDIPVIPAITNRSPHAPRRTVNSRVPPRTTGSRWRRSSYLRQHQHLPISGSLSAASADCCKLLFELHMRRRRVSWLRQY